MGFSERGKYMKVKFNFRQYVWIFAIGCYVGYAIETLWCLIKNGYIESRSSLVLGHLSVAYGMGAVLLTLILIHLLSRAGDLLRLRCVGLQPSTAQYQRTGLSAVLRFLGRDRTRMGETHHAAAEQNL